MTYHTALAPLPPSAIAAALVPRLEMLIGRILPQARRIGDCYIMGSSREIIVHARGPQAGTFTNTATGARGDLVDLARDRYGSLELGLEHALLALDRLPSTAVAKVLDGPFSQEEAAAREAALKIWRTGEAIQDTPAAAFLKRFGADPADAPPSFRFAHIAYSRTGLMLPVLIGAVTGPSRKVDAIALSFITGDGKLAGVAEPEIVIGPVRRGAMKLAPGDGDELALADTLERAIAFQEARMVPAWATCGQPLDCAAVPPNVARLFIVTGADGGGRRAAERAAFAFRHEGRVIERVELDAAEHQEAGHGDR